MSREEIRKLLGGYATDTLSEAERRALFEAALEDQDLFDALAKDQALRDVLQDSSARQQLIAALGTAREPVAARAWRWLRWPRQPAALAMAGGMAVLLIVGALVLRQTRQHARPAALIAEAVATRQPTPTAAAPSAAPLKKMEPPEIARKRKRLAQLPAPVAMPAPPPPASVPSSVEVAGAAEAKRQMLPTAQVPSQSFIAGSRPPMAVMVRAKAAPSKAAKLAVQYALLLKDAGGAYASVPSSAVFHAGDSVRLQVEPSEAGYIYLFQRDATAGWKLVASQSVDKAQRYELPSTGGLQSDMPAQLELLLVLSRLEQPALETARAAVDALVEAAEQPAVVKITLEYR